MSQRQFTRAFTGWAATKTLKLLLPRQIREVFFPFDFLILFLKSRKTC